ncbi:MAG: PAS domain S-box protein [Desulfobacteraceae bacterium]|nr:PAS domain S-box protein [Desulfobacteraceae bacterium]
MNAKYRSLKSILLIFILPVLACGAFASILFNYYLARENIQLRIDDHILRRRMDLKFIASLPSLYLVLENQSFDPLMRTYGLKRENEKPILSYLKQLRPSFPHTLRIISLDGKELLLINDCKIQKIRTDAVATTHINALAMIKAYQEPELPIQNYLPGKEMKIIDILPLYSKGRLNGALVYEYGFDSDVKIAPITENLGFNIFVSLNLLVIVSIITYFLVDFATRPLKQLTAAVRKMIDGDMSKPFRINGLGEARSLFMTFERLRQCLVDQNEQSKAYTNELASALQNAKRMKAQLLQELDYSVGILKKTPNLICGISPDGSIKFVNPAAERITGYSSEKLMGENFKYLLINENVDKFMSVLHEGMKNKAFVNEEFILNTKSNKNLTLLLSAFHRIDENGQVKEFILIGSDITEMKLTEKELEKFRSISDRSNCGMAIYDLNGNITYINDAYASMHGYLKSELEGKHQSVFFGVRLMPQQEQLNNQLMRRGHLTAEEILHVRKDGGTIPLLLNSTLVRDDTGKPMFSSETAIDISEKKILQEQLQIKQRMDSLGTMAAGISHDFNNLLSGITGYLDLLHLRSDNFTDKQKRYLNQLTASVERATNLVHQFQTLSNGNVSKKEHLDISAFVNGVFGFLQKTSDRVIRKQNCIDPGRFFIKGNQTELSQVFLNLAVNAKEAIEAKGIEGGDFIRAEAGNVLISETKEQALRGGRYVHVKFLDSGCGMSEIVRSRVFDPLFSSKKMGQRKGQGLGLAMAYTIIKNHSGHISVESKPDKGAIFHVYLPAAAPSVTDPAIAHDLAKGNETIFLVDDEQLLLRVMKEELEQLGYCVISASSSEEALKIYQTKFTAIDLVIMEFILPGMSGETLLSRINELNTKAKIILMSGKNLPSNMNNLKHKVSGFLTKPLVLKDLSEALRRVLDS